MISRSVNHKTKAVIGLTALISLLIAAAVPVRAANTGPRLGVVDVEQVTRQSESIQKTIRKAESAVQDKQKKIDDRMADLQQKRQELNQQASVLSDDELAERGKDLRDLKEEIDDLQYQVNKQLERIRIDMMNPEVDRIMDTVRKVAEEEGYDLIIRSDMALYFNEKADVTSLVIKALDKTAAKPVVPAPPAAKTGDAKSETQE